MLSIRWNSPLNYEEMKEDLQRITKINFFVNITGKE